MEKGELIIFGVDGVDYVSPFTLFSTSNEDKKALDGWLDHYTELNIRVMLFNMSKNRVELLVNHEDHVRELQKI